MTFYPARVLLKFTSPRFQRLFSSSNNEGAGGQKPGSHMGTFDWDTTHINSDGFSSASNAKYMEFLYAKWIKDKNSIHESWQKFFSKFEDDQDKSEKNTSSTKKSTSRKNLNPNPLECKRGFGSEKNSSNGSKTIVSMPLAQYTIDDGRGSFGFTPIPGNKKVNKPNADKEGVRRPNKSEEEKRRRRSPRSEPGLPPISKFEETEVHYFPMPDVWNPSIHIDWSETSFIPGSPSTPKLDPTKSVKEPDSYDNCEGTLSFDEILKNIEKCQKNNIISRELSKDTTLKEPLKNVASKDFKSLKGPSNIIKPSGDVTKKTKTISLQKPNNPIRSPIRSKENLDVASRKSSSQKGVVEKNQIPKSMAKVGDQHKHPKAPLNPPEGKNHKEENSPELKDPKTVKIKDVVEVSPDASNRNLRQPLKFPEKPSKTDKPEIKVNKKNPLRKGFIKPASQPDITIPPRKTSKSSEESLVTGDNNNKNAAGNWKRTHKRNLLEKLIRRLEKNPKNTPQDKLSNRRSFKSIEDYMEPKVFDGIEQLINDLKTMPWAGTPQQRRLDTMKRLQNYNNSLKSANEKLRRLANERNKAFMKCVLAHRQAFVDTKSKRIKTDKSKCSESPSLKATLRDSPGVFTAPEILFQDKLDNSPPRLGLTEREKIILYDQNQKATSALKSSLKKLEKTKSKVLMGKVNKDSMKEIPTLETKDKKDKPEDKPQP